MKFDEELSTLEKEFNALDARKAELREKMKDLKRQVARSKFDKEVKDEISFIAQCEPLVQYEAVHTVLTLTPKSEGFINQFKIIAQRKLVDLGPEVEVIIRRK